MDDPDADTMMILAGVVISLIAAAEWYPALKRMRERKLRPTETSLPEQ
jgi:uncharacterized membrane protein YidH (DUF202 family)